MMQVRGVCAVIQVLHPVGQHSSLTFFLGT